MNVNGLRIALVIPCYNEEFRLNVQEFSNFLGNPANANVDLLFVNDGSKDQTIRVLQELQKNFQT